jgi:hypothetical protein
MPSLRYCLLGAEAFALSKKIIVASEDGSSKSPTPSVDIQNGRKYGQKLNDVYTAGYQQIDGASIKTEAAHEQWTIIY